MGSVAKVYNVLDGDKVIYKGTVVQIALKMAVDSSVIYHHILQKRMLNGRYKFEKSGETVNAGSFYHKEDPYEAMKMNLKTHGNFYVAKDPTEDLKRLYEEEGIICKLREPSWRREPRKRGESRPKTEYIIEVVNGLQGI